MYTVRRSLRLATVRDLGPPRQVRLGIDPLTVASLVSSTAQSGFQIASWFGGGKKSHAEREAAEASRANSAVGQFATSVLAATSFQDLWTRMVYWQSHDQGGSSPIAVGVTVGTIDQVPGLGDLWNVSNGGHIQAPGWGSVIGNNRYVTPAEWFRRALQQPELVRVEPSAGVAESLKDKQTGVQALLQKIGELYQTNASELGLSPPPGGQQGAVAEVPRPPSPSSSPSPTPTETPQQLWTRAISTPDGPAIAAQKFRSGEWPKQTVLAVLRNHMNESHAQEFIAQLEQESASAALPPSPPPLIPAVPPPAQGTPAQTYLSTVQPRFLDTPLPAWLGGSVGGALGSPWTWVALGSAIVLFSIGQASPAPRRRRRRGATQKGG